MDIVGVNAERARFNVTKKVAQLLAESGKIKRGAAGKGNGHVLWERVTFQGVDLPEKYKK